jgi:hypothetical protein
MPEHRAFVGHTPSNAATFDYPRSLTALLQAASAM